ncbi:MAG: MgtC/SapB family protein [Halobacteriales archaeon]|nr:MgtC/SapB family protein [Halobacteriales archaeon]
MVDPAADSLLTIAGHVAVAFGIGALIGLEREHAESGGTFAGSRTFPLFALYGALVGLFFPTLLPLAFVAIALPLTVAYAGKVWTDGDIGLTTLTAALLTVVLGAMTTHSRVATSLAIIVAGVMTVLLTSKGRIHEFADRIEDAERRATIQFILVVLVVFPLLPNRELSVLFGLNPRFVWLMVVLVTGLSFVAYVLSRVVGAHRGIALTGILGGFVSSTATTVSMANRTAETPDLYRVCAFSTIIAAVVMFPRAIIEIAIVNRSLLPHVLVPLGAMTIAGGMVAGAIYWRTSGEAAIEVDIENPFRLRPALFFGALFAAVLLVSEYANAWLGTSGVYATAFVSGLADVDAIALTLSRLAAEGAITSEVATTGIVIAAVANTVVKAGLAWVLGTGRLGRLVTLVLGIVAAVGVGLALLI